MKNDDARAAFRAESERKHKEIILSYLSGKNVDESRLWLAVGFFQYHPELDHSFAAYKWHELLTITGRGEE